MCPYPAQARKAHPQRPSSSRLVTAPPEMDHSDSYCPGVTGMLLGRICACHQGCNQLRLPGRDKQHEATASTYLFLKDFFTIPLSVSFARHPTIASRVAVSAGGVHSLSVDLAKPSSRILRSGGAARGCLGPSAVLPQAQRGFEVLRGLTQKGQARAALHPGTLVVGDQGG